MPNITPELNPIDPPILNPYQINESRLIAKLTNPAAIVAFKIANPTVTVNMLHYFASDENYDLLSPIQKDLYNTIVIIPKTGSGSLKTLYEKMKPPTPANPPTPTNESVVYVQYDQNYALCAQGSGSVPNNSWWFAAINAPFTINQGVASEDDKERNPVKVAVIDTGIKHAHTDLTPTSFTVSLNRRDFLNLTWKESNPKTNPATYVPTKNGQGDEIDLKDKNNVLINGDTDGHGTHVAGIIGAILNNNIQTVGLAYMATLMNLRAFQGGNEAILAVAVRYAADQKAHVINASWGSKIDYIKNPNAGSAIYDALRYASTKGTVMVCAAGNDNADVKDYIPAKFDNVITVGSIEKKSTGPGFVKAASSNYGPKVYAAPGVGILSLSHISDTTLKSLEGSSMAAAFVTGLVARMIHKKSNLLPISTTPINLANIVRTAIKVSPTPIQNLTLGLIDVSNTLSNIVRYPA